GIPGRAARGLQADAFPPRRGAAPGGGRPLAAWRLPGRWRAGRSGLPRLAAPVPRPARAARSASLGSTGTARGDRSALPDAGDRPLGLLACRPDRGKPRAFLPHGKLVRGVRRRRVPHPAASTFPAELEETPHPQPEALLA